MRLLLLWRLFYEVMLGRVVRVFCSDFSKLEFYLLRWSSDGNLSLVTTLSSIVEKSDPPDLLWRPRMRSLPSLVIRGGRRVNCSKRCWSTDPKMLINRSKKCWLLLLSGGQVWWQFIQIPSILKIFLFLSLSLPNHYIDRLDNASSFLPNDVQECGIQDYSSYSNHGVYHPGIGNWVS